MKDRKSTRIVALGVTLLLLLSLLPTSAIAAANMTVVNNAAAAKNVILMIGDGMGLDHVKAAEMTNLLSIADTDAVTTVTTRSNDAEVTDSAAAATAMSCGIKTNNSYVGLDPNGNQVMTMTEYAQSLGMRTGLVVTEILPHATPAGFSAHEIGRWNYDNIAKDQMSSEIDVMFGGGSSYFDGLNSSIDRAGYEYYTSFRAVPDTLGDRKILGAFGSGAIPQVDSSNQPTGYPTLSAMTSRALDLLGGDDNDRGFFLMVEGSKIDSYAHGGNLEAMISEAQAFDLSIKVAKDYTDTHPDTLLIVTADHQTGELKLDEDGWKFSAVNGHTAADVGVWAYGAGANALNTAGSIDNTDIATYIRKSLELYNGRTATVETGDTVALRLPSNCGWNTVWAYAWDDNSYNPLGGWPGSQMTYDEESGLYFLTSGRLLATDKLIFSNGGSDQSEDITDGIVFYSESDQTVYTLGTASGSEGKWTVDTDTTGGDTVRRVYFENTLGWSSVRLYAWNDNGEKPLGEWDSTPTMRQINETNLWYYEETTVGELNNCSIIFRSGSDQSANITNGIRFDDWVYSVSESCVANTTNVFQVICEKKNMTVSETNQTIYFDAAETNWEDVYLYASYGENSGTKLFGEWPGVKMTYEGSTGLYAYQDVDGKLKNISGLSGSEVIIHDGSSDNSNTGVPQALAIPNDKIYYGAVYSVAMSGQRSQYQVVGIEPTYTVAYQDNVGGRAFAAEVYSGLRYGDSTPQCSLSRAGTLDKVEGYTFKEWDSAVAPTVTGDVTYIAKYEPRSDPDDDPVISGYTGFITKSNGKTYYYDNGVMAVGVTRIGEDDYYFYPVEDSEDYGAMRTGSQVINGVRYQFYPDGRMYHPTVITFSDDCGIMTVKLQPYDENQRWSAIRMAVWSQTDGQDDLRWFHAQEQDDGSWILQIPMCLYSLIDRYIIHIYDGATLVDHATISVPVAARHEFTDDQDATCNYCGFERQVEIEKEPTVSMFRLYNPNTGEHFYTGSTDERDSLEEIGWQYEGIAWNAPSRSGSPVHRLFNPNSGDHHYTMSWEEVQNLVEVGWQYEGVAWNSASASSSNVANYRLYNPNAETGIHHYTSSLEERDNLVELGWKDEGIAWFGIP